MSNGRAKQRNQRPKLVDRLELRLASGRQIDGVWVGVSLDWEPEPVLCRVEEALRLIKIYDRLRYDRLVRDLERVWVRMVPGALGRFNSSLRACELDRGFVLAETSLPELIATAIVHEATHARLMCCGIGYGEDLRARVERVCFRRELAFAAKLPNGERIREQAEQALVGLPHDYWTDAAVSDRSDKDNSAALRDLGIPDWVVRTLFALRAVRLGAIRLARRLTRW